jgi:hypothetical protein
MNTFHPQPWSAFPGECLLYFALMCVLHFAIFSAGCLVLATVAIKQPGTFAGRAGRFGFFMALLLLVGAIFNGLWSCMIWGELYFSTDYTFDFSPFWPITQKLIDGPFGGMRGQLLGVSLFQLQLLWLLFAVGTWGVTILLFRLIRRRPPANKALQATTASP